MNAKELKDKIIGMTKLSSDKIHSLHSLMLDECCEKALENDVNDDTHLVSAILAFNVANDAIIGIIDAGLKDADIVNINYRGGNFPFEKNSLTHGF